MSHDLGDEDTETGVGDDEVGLDVGDAGEVCGGDFGDVAVVEVAAITVCVSKENIMLSGDQWKKG